MIRSFKLLIYKFLTLINLLPSKDSHQVLIKEQILIEKQFKNIKKTKFRRLPLFSHLLVSIKVYHSQFLSAEYALVSSSACQFLIHDAVDWF